MIGFGRKRAPEGSARPAAAAGRLTGSDSRGAGVPDRKQKVRRRVAIMLGMRRRKRRNGS